MQPAAGQFDLFTGPADRPLVAPCLTLLERPRPLTEPRRVYLGTSSWAFSGWRGLVYRDAYSESTLSREGLRAYSQHPLLNSVGIDRGFYTPLSADQYAIYAAQVPEPFRFLVKAPGFVTAALTRGPGGVPEPNPNHLDATLTFDQFVAPCAEGLGDKLGVLVLQFSPLPRGWLVEPARWIERLGHFLEALQASMKRSDSRAASRVAVEVRDAELLTPRLIRTLRQTGTLYCVGLHDRMPVIGRQLAALDALEAGRRGPLVVRWNLRRGFGYSQAKARYAPFDALVDPDPQTRAQIARRAADVLNSGQPVYVIANNKAEGSAPRTLALLADLIAANLTG